MRGLVWGAAALPAGAAVLAGAVVFVGPVWAQEDSDIPFATVDLGGGFSIDVPALLADRIKPGKDAPPETMMAFNVSAGDPGTLSCELIRFPYSAQEPRETLMANLAKSEPDNFCKVDRPGVRDWQSSGVTMAQSDGLPGATCLAAYTDTSQQAQGRVLTMDLVAGKKNYFQLVCVNAFDDKDGAVAAYAMRWSPIITRLQKSFHLPADEK